MARIVDNYFQTLFASSSPSSMNLARVLDTVEPRVTQDINTQLEKPFILADVKAIVFQMAHSKSPKADGMLALFFIKIIGMWLEMRLPLHVWEF